MQDSYWSATCFIATVFMILFHGKNKRAAARSLQSKMCVWKSALTHTRSKMDYGCLIIYINKATVYSHTSTNFVFWPQTPVDPQFLAEIKLIHKTQFIPILFRERSEGPILLLSVDKVTYLFQEIIILAPMFFFILMLKGEKKQTPLEKKKLNNFFTWLSPD